MEVGQSNKIIAIIQARMQSTRLPGKVLMPMPFAGDKNILWQIVNQLRKSKFVSKIVIATSKCKTDDEIASFCERNHVLVYRGDEDDVHSRFFDILKNSSYNSAVRVTGDNPIIDYEYLDIVLQNHIDTHSDYSFTTDLPIGMNFEVFDVKAFLGMSTLQLSCEEKEHVTLRFKSENTFNKNLIKIDTCVHQKIRVTIDYLSDYLVVSSLFDLSKKVGIEPGIKLVQFVLSKYPWIFQVNENNFQKKHFSTLYEEIAYSIDVLNNLDLKKSAQYLSKHV
jgi:spore coat polysaccharide biosynthesis protein SpsF